MSRTNKDKKWKLRHPENDFYFGTEMVSYTKVFKSVTSNEVYLGIGHWCRDIPGVKKKKKRAVPGDWLWFRATPSWWTRLIMNKPKRRACRVWERQVLLQDVDEADCPDYGRKPHTYFW